MTVFRKFIDWWDEVTRIRPAAKRSVKLLEKRESAYEMLEVSQRSEMVMPLLYLLDRIEAEDNAGLAKQRIDILKDHSLVIEYKDVAKG